MKSIRKFIALLLVAALFAGFMPAEELGAAMAETIPASLDGAVDSRAFAGLPNAALQMAQGGESRLTRDGWRYVRFPDTGYAAIVGYEGETADTLSLPDMLGGADVVAVAPDALAALKGVRTVDVPGNVRAIGDHALPRGATVRALSGSYAAEWAARCGHAFASASEYDFREGVADLSDVRPENFVRVSANEVWLRDLEASRLSVGQP